MSHNRSLAELTQEARAAAAGLVANTVSSPGQPSVANLPEVSPGASARVVALPIPEGDVALVQALVMGRREARTVLFDRYGADIERVLLRVLGPDLELGDLLQDVFVAAFDSIANLKDPQALRGWLISIAVNKARKRIRKRQRWRFIRFLDPEELPEVESIATPVEVSEALRSTYAVLSVLPADERIVFALRFVDGMDLRQVAEVCHVSVATVKRRLARAQEKFVALARREESLLEWMKQGTRWS